MASETELTPSPTDEFEECLLLVEFNGIIDDEFLHSCLNSREPCQILGLESDAPILQLGNYSFEGKFEDTLGTSVIFEKQSADTTTDSSGTKSQSDEIELAYSDYTNKKLTLTRIFLNKKKDDDDAKSNTT